MEQLKVKLKPKLRILAYNRTVTEDFVGVILFQHSVLAVL